MVKISQLPSGSAPQLTDPVPGNESSTTRKWPWSAIRDLFFNNIPAGSVNAAAVDFGGDGSGIWWEEIGRHDLDVADDVLTLTVPERKHLKILVFTIATGNNRHQMTFNSDTGGNYALRESSNGGADSSVTGANSISLLGGDITVPCRYEIELNANIADQEKIATARRIYATAGAGNAPNRAEQVGKWANTTQMVTTVTVTNGGSGSYAAGSYMVILGHD
jgi:hypothetical protein